MVIVGRRCRKGTGDVGDHSVIYVALNKDNRGREEGKMHYACLYRNNRIEQLFNPRGLGNGLCFRNLHAGKSNPIHIKPRFIRGIETQEEAG